MRLRDKVALVTGSGQGIGKAIALLFAEEGAKVALCDLNDGTLRQTLGEVADRGAEAIAIKADVTSSREIAAMVAQIRERFGRIDILVNNAGRDPQDTTHLLEVTEEAWDSCVQVNLKSVFLVSREVLPLMIDQGRGNIVNFSSTAARIGNEKMRPHYSAAKAGVLGLTRHMAREFGPLGIRVNAVCPGYVVSGQWFVERWATRPDREQLLADVALRRTSTPEEPAAAVLFLASDESSYISGATLDVSGGRFCA